MRDRDNQKSTGKLVKEDKSMQSKESTNQTLVRIARGLAESIDKFLATDEARLRGLDSRVDVVNEAVRQLLKTYGVL